MDPKEAFAHCCAAFTSTHCTAVLRFKHVVRRKEPLCIDFDSCSKYVISDNTEDLMIHYIQLYYRTLRSILLYL